jgi:hypothetical protein
MGVVYRARQEQPDRIVALKVIAVDLADDPAFRARFRRESSVAAQIEHPNVIPVYAIGEADGVLYIAMRFVDGSDLRTLLAQEDGLEPRRAATIVDQVSQALDAAHARGLVHRDVKPANILISTIGGRDHVYLSDFGLSRHLEGSQGLTGTGAFLGTIDYVAPEQARGEGVDARTDVYSLGCVLFEALTGTVPFPMDNDLAKLYAHDSQPPPSVLERAPNLPVAFESVLQRAMAKAPDQRYLSAGDLGRAAVAAASGASPLPAERSVAVGGAAPVDTRTVPARPTVPAAGSSAPAVLDAADDETASAVPTGGSTATPPPARSAPAAARRRRRVRIAAAALAAGLAAVAGIVVALASGGGSGQEVTTLSAPVQGINVAPIPDQRVVWTKEVGAPAGYRYRLVLATTKAPAGASLDTPVPYYFILSARRGNEPFATVQQLKLPFSFTASSSVASFQLDPNPDGSANVGLSWFVKRGDATDVTHYFTVSPSGINID